MKPLLMKEFSAFFASITGYLIIIIFLVILGLFTWVFPGHFNLLDSGYANLDTVFILSPWIFLFLVPAVTMRMFSEEKKTGTLDILITRPISDLTIVVAKFITALLLVIVALIPTLLYYITIWYLGNPVGNIDSGATWGSYIGLIFLAAIYVSIGLYASSITDNQIIAFLLGAVLSFVFFFGFDALGGLPFFSGFSNIIYNIGISEHYKSISRGVVDSRDIVYFLSIITIFILLTKTKLASRKWK
ncbi:MAG: gliding motility-associated ABC transporter permease subunit GldF [Bacteroidales bacterium]|nr:gliding motility-associated ABC transporter permease subunit GldF [Bacteroidales bacterium]